MVVLNATGQRKLGQSMKVDLEPRTGQVTAVADTGTHTITAV